MRVSAVTIRRTLFREMSVFHIIFGWTTQTLIFLLSLLFIVFLCYCLYIKHIHMKYDHIPGPPRDSFFLGHSPTLLRIGKDNQVIYDKFLEWALVYGSVYRMNLLHYVFICVTCPEATKGILMSPKFPKDKFVYKRLFNLFGQRFLGNGLITAQDYDQWYKMRRIMDPAFSSLYLKDLMGAFNETAEKLMDKLTEIADEKKEANMLHLLNRVIMDVLTKESMTKEDEECMLDNFMTFFIAGQETTTNQLAFCVMELARHPDILEKAKKEADEVIGMKQDMNYDDLGQLSYLSQVLKETLRIYPTAPSTYRELVEDIVIGSFHIPRGVTCLFSSYVTGRMDKFFKDPLTFDPDRFHPEAPKPYYCYYPFALGPRSCLGQNFSQMEAKVVMAKLLQRFDFPLVPGQTFDILDEWCATSDTGLRRNKMQQNPITDLPSCSSQTS